MPAVSLTTLRARVRERADMASSAFIGDTATGMDAFINEGVQKLHEKLVDAMGEEYASSTFAFATVANQSDYALPSGFFKLYGVDLDLNGTTKALRPYMRSERNAYKQSQTPLARLPRAPRYYLTGNTLRLYPPPAGGLSGQVLYAPEATTLVAGADTVTFPNGWERYVVLYAAIQALIKEETSVRELQAVLDAEDVNIEKMKMERDFANPMQVVDNDVSNYEWLF